MDADLPEHLRLTYQYNAPMLTAAQAAFPELFEATIAVSWLASWVRCPTLRREDLRRLCRNLLFHPLGNQVATSQGAPMALQVTTLVILITLARIT